MKKMLLMLNLCVLAGCSAYSPGSYFTSTILPQYSPSEYDKGLFNYSENEFIETSTLKNINLNLDTSISSYSYIRKQINELSGSIDKYSINIEEMINYFNYSYKNNINEDITLFSEIGKAPWNNNNYVIQLAMKSKDIDHELKSANNFVFVIDVSGSMNNFDKLPLMIEGFNLILDQLDNNDRISLVTYSANEAVLLDGEHGDNKLKIKAAFDDLYASGDTNCSDAIKKAYDIAEENYIKDGNNKIFLCTDGDFNVGVTNINDLENFIIKKREVGLNLSVLGFGLKDFNTSTVQSLAQKGVIDTNYIDSTNEAVRIFTKEIHNTNKVLAKEAKAKITFNPEFVHKYRVLGYENKLLTNNYNNYSNGIEIKSANTTIYLFEVALRDGYKDGNIINYTLSYKDPSNDSYKILKNSIDNIYENVSNDFIFSTSVCELALLLKDSKYKENSNYQNIIDRLEDNNNILDDDYKLEFLSIVKKAERFFT